MRVLNRRPARENPTICSGCFAFISRRHGGAEIECTMLLADIRGSTAIAEAVPPASFQAFLDRFYRAAAAAVFRHDGTIDKFVGDELVAIFLPLLCGNRHAQLAVAAARDLLLHPDLAGHDAAPVGVGAGIHTGIAWYGTIGQGTSVDVTAVGDAMNVTARLASAARAGEILVSGAAAARAGLGSGLARRSIVLRGRREPMNVVVVPVP